MEIVSMFLVIVGVVMALVGTILFLIESFRASVWWGLACLLLLPVQLIFLIRDWEAAKNPFLIQMLGIFCVLVSAILAAYDALPALPVV